MMTNEQAIKMLKSKMDGYTDTSYEWAETVRMAIKALEQEPCDDCISKQAVLDILKKYVLGESSIAEEVIDLPPVTPKPTRWIPVSESLPEYDKHVLMFYSQDKMEVGYYHYDNTFYPTEYADLNDTGWYDRDGDAVDEPIAWIQLPE